jgi:hypothetical protein
VPELPEVETIVRDLGAAPPRRPSRPRGGAPAGPDRGRAPDAFARGLARPEGAERRPPRQEHRDRPGGGPPGREPGDDRPAAGRRRGRAPAAHRRASRAGGRPRAALPRRAPLRPALADGRRGVDGAGGAAGDGAALRRLHRRVAPRGARRSRVADQDLADGPGAGGRRREHLRQRGALPGRLDPRRPASSLSAAEAARVRDGVREVLREAIDYRGTTLLDYRDAAGREGAFAARLRSTTARASPAPPAGRRSSASSRPAAPPSSAPPASAELRRPGGVFRGVRARRIWRRTIFSGSAFLHRRPRHREENARPPTRCASWPAVARNVPGTYRMLGAGRRGAVRGEVEAPADAAPLLLPRPRGEKQHRIAGGRGALEWDYEPSEFAALLRELR